MKRDYKVDVIVRQPKVAYKDAIPTKGKPDGKHVNSRLVAQFGEMHDPDRAVRRC